MAKTPLVLRMRRELKGFATDPDWPAGARIKTLDECDARAAHAVLEAGYYEGGGGAPTFRKWQAQLRKDKEFEAALCFLALDAQGVVGVCQCWTSAFVKDLAVHPRFRRRGIGRALMISAFAAFKARGADHVDLKVREENVAAQALYRSLSMRIIARDPG